MSDEFVNVIHTPTGERITTIKRLNEIVDIIKQEAVEAYRIKLYAENAITPKGRSKGTYKLSEHDRQQIRLLFEQGTPKSKIADMYDISVKTVDNYLKMPKIRFQRKSL